MATRKIYQVFDTTADCVATQPFSEKNDGAAIRAFYDVLRDNRTLPGQHPADFELRLVGIQVEETGAIEEPIQGQAASSVRVPYIVVATGAAWLEGQKQLEQPELPWQIEERRTAQLEAERDAQMRTQR